MPASSERSRPSVLPTELLVNLTLRELRGKFKRTALGWGWSVLNPVLMLLVYATVFGTFIRLEQPPGDPSGLDSYPFFLICALLPWTFFATSLTSAGGSYVTNEALVKKVYFPRSVLPAAAVSAALITFLVELGVLSVALIAAGNMVLPWLPVVLLVVALNGAFAFGLGLVLAAANARFRDVSHLLTIGINVWFYATPVIYPLSYTEGKEVLGLEASDIIRANPMYHFVSAYRDLFYDMRFPSAGHWAVMVIVAASAVAVGTLVHRRIEPRLAEVL